MKRMNRQLVLICCSALILLLIGPFSGKTALAQFSRPPTLAFWDSRTHQIQHLVPATEFAWSPDGQKLAVINARGFCIIAKDGTYERCIALITEGYALAAFHQPSWSPEGQYLAYIGYTSLQDPHLDGESVLVIVRKDLTEVSRVSANVENYFWAPDGKYLAFVEDRGGGPNVPELGLGVFNLATLRSTYLTPFTPDFVQSKPGQLLWSPTDLLVYAYGAPGYIYTNNVEGTAEKQIITLSGFVEDVQWTPDGKQITYTSDFWTFVLKNAGGPIKPLFHAPLIAGAWSSDGHHLVIAGACVMDFDGALSGCKKTFPFPRQIKSFSWSSDNRQIAYDFDMGIQLASADSGDIEDIDVAELPYAPKWSPNEPVLAFIAQVSNP